MSLSDFLGRVAMIIEKWAEQRNPVRIDCLNFADEPLAAYKWSLY